VVILRGVEQVAIAGEGRAKETRQRLRRRTGLRFVARKHPLQQPRQRARQIGPADRQRAHRIGQPFGHLLQHARQRHRHDRRHTQAAGVAERAAFANARLIEQRDLVALPLQLQRTGRADNAGAHHGDLLTIARSADLGSRHALASLPEHHLPGQAVLERRQAFQQRERGAAQVAKRPAGHGKRTWQQI
ncbi:hypothetical protein COLO4_01508, partial [Corchorus olitorius]